MKEFIDNNFFEITMLCILIVFYLSLFIFLTNADNECEKDNDSRICKQIQEAYK